MTALQIQERCSELSREMYRYWSQHGRVLPAHQHEIDSLMAKLKVIERNQRDETRNLFNQLKVVGK
jgi:hypothetical protein